MRCDLVSLHIANLKKAEHKDTKVDALVEAVKALLKDKKEEPNQDNDLPYTLKLKHSEWAIVQNALFKAHKDPYALGHTKTLIWELYQKVREIIPITKSKL